MAHTRPAPLAMTKGRREHRKHLTRQELLAAGRRLFGEQGLYESRIEDLTRHAGIAKGTIYGYFANKQELMEAVVTAGFSELYGEVDRATHGATNPRERLAMCVQAHFDFFDTNPDLMRVFHQVRGLLKFNLPEGRPLRRVLMHYLGSLGRTIAPLVGSPPRTEAESLELATLLFGAISGVASTHAALAGLPPNRAQSRRAAQAIAEMVLQHANLRSAPARASRRPASTSARAAQVSGPRMRSVRPTRGRLST